MHNFDNNGADESVYLGFWQEAMVGGASGFCSATAICPAEVVKVRMQCDRGSASTTATNGSTECRSAGFVECGLRLWHEEGRKVSFATSGAGRETYRSMWYSSAYTTYIDAACTFHGVEKVDFAYRS